MLGSGTVTCTTCTVQVPVQVQQPNPLAALAHPPMGCAGVQVRGENWGQQ